jgi:hypothetical protein
MSECEWYPADWIDESCPPAKKAPAEFAFFDGEGWQLGYSQQDNLADDAEQLNAPLAPGDVVNFITCERLGEVEITLRRDGSYDLHGATIPRGHNSLCIDGDSDTIHESFDALIEAIKTEPVDHFHICHLIFPDGVDADRFQVSFANWSDLLPHLFEVEDGKPVFRPVPDQKN